MNLNAAKKLFASHGLKVLRWDGKFKSALIKNHAGKEDARIWIAGSKQEVEAKLKAHGLLDAPPTSPV
ncbi:MAG: hypothetical protein P4M15_09020 [Alphaproteobacteria bacterium]|nr:hypothetical protein [Alphaproteobacteria bacterium]